VLTSNPDGMPVMVVRVEHPDYASAATISEVVMAEIRSQCEVRATVEVVAPNTLPKTEFKAKRVRDERKP